MPQIDTNHWIGRDGARPSHPFLRVSAPLREIKNDNKDNIKVNKRTTDQHGRAALTLAHFNPKASVSDACPCTSVVYSKEARTDREGACLHAPHRNGANVNVYVCKCVNNQPPTVSTSIRIPRHRNRHWKRMLIVCSFADFHTYTLETQPPLGRDGARPSRNETTVNTRIASYPLR